MVSAPNKRRRQGRCTVSCKTTKPSGGPASLMLCWLCMQGAAGSDAHLIRVMPNTPCLVGESASAMCLGGKANEKDSDDVHALFAAVGKIFKVVHLWVGSACLCDGCYCC